MNKNIKQKNNGSILIVVVFVIALMAAVIAGLLQMDSERIGLMRNQVFSTQATSIAEAGLADAFAQIRGDNTWTSGFTNKSFGGGSYTVTAGAWTSNTNTITSTGTSPQSFVTEIAADITIGSTSPYVIRVNSLRINE
ncbi:MAG: hypothetical protein K8R02_03510 [Anaerohalosphaeraceae bacterium]|nr:hypothetical protein [Anaerohalosphaeraceae bacterium]